MRQPHSVDGRFLMAAKPVPSEIGLKASTRNPRVRTAAGAPESFQNDAEQQALSRESEPDEAAGERLRQPNSAPFRTMPIAMTLALSPRERKFGG